MGLFDNQENSPLSMDGTPLSDKYHPTIDAKNATASVVKNWIEETKEEENFDSIPIRMQGYLRKRFHYSYYMGSYRFCVLLGTTLRWYLTREDARSRLHNRGQVVIQALEAWSGYGSMHTYPHAFALRTGRNRLLLCSAETVEAKIQWIDAIENALQTTKAGLESSGIFGADRRVVPKDAIRANESIGRRSSVEASSFASSCCRYCGICLRKVFVRKVTCGCCKNDFCSKHCGQCMQIPGSLGASGESKRTIPCRRCIVCVQRLIFREHLKSMVRIMTAILQKENGMRMLLDVSSHGEVDEAIRGKADGSLAHRLQQSPMSLIHAIQLIYHTRTTPYLFLIACERLPYYAENAIDRIENLWYQILHLLECIDVRIDPEAYFVQLFYLKRYIRGICRRAPRIALQTIWHAQASLTYPAHPHSHTFLDLLGFIFPPPLEVSSGIIAGKASLKDAHMNDSHLWSSILLSDCPEKLHSAICDVLHQASQASEALIDCEADSWTERWLNANSTTEFQRCASEVNRLGKALCEYNSSITYDLFEGRGFSDDNAKLLRGRLQADTAVRLERLVLKQVEFVQSLAMISDKLRLIHPIAHRKSVLAKELELLNESLDGMELYPLCSASDQLYKVVRIPPDEGTVFTTKQRAPTMIFIEAVPIDVHEREDEYDDEPLRPFYRSSRQSSAFIDHDLEEHFLDDDVWDANPDGRETKDSYESDSYSKSTPYSFTPGALFSNNSRLMDRESANSIQSNGSSIRNSFTKSLPGGAHRTSTHSVRGKKSISLAQKQVSGKVSTMVYDSDIFGECWSEKQARIRSSSPMGHFPGWRLFSVIVKTNDDLRQEMFAMQLIDQFRQIFDREKLSLWLRTYRIVATGSDIGLLETITDACSLDHLKKSFGRRNRGSLWEYFQSAYGQDQSNNLDALESARSNFINSMAAYSLVSYILQLKDRHNGNILLSSEGHIVHIDFGFILGISPGRAFSLEDAPFKLTSEMVQVIGGLTSVGFQRFRTLLADGLIALQKHQQELLTLLQLTGQKSTFPCFSAVNGSRMRCRQLERILAGMKHRLRGFETRCELEQQVDALIRKSYNAWGTRQYDAYQYRSNNIDL
uniref:1-phosphatidylinositol 4-kinase n=1 Tax=Albugo laibachii Nc14 TaxID=890382 RepID=F0WYQ0_9STRA|nr:phosphatidylinositol kinase (PIKG3) putative [Albugo laibachii Nc14]|eukprot:CCA26609.1 phosphatidylinositol kinase (PIKG3) putative [Albugo laibachii Nc14]